MPKGIGLHQHKGAIVPSMADHRFGAFFADVAQARPARGASEVTSERTGRVIVQEPRLDGRGTGSLLRQGRASAYKLHWTGSLAEGD